ncbi:mechanosensitive ion channel domain-containing protein [Lyngbya aestuarii]|uniref:mechanosensitive ion channel domain-containing protein n=1 Tax=Lyngbya aestuarii TaxID=118322 RepID=UPI00403D950D
MASLKQMPFLALSAAHRRFWRRYQGSYGRSSRILSWLSHLGQNYGKVLLLAVLTLLLTLVSVPSTAQTTATNGTQKSPVVIDGQVLFEVGNSGKFTAADRAEMINETLKEEVRSPEPVQIEVDQEEQLPTLRLGKKFLLAVTPEDVIPGTNPSEQVLTWKSSIETALKQGKLERTPGYYFKALSISIGVLLAALTIQVSLEFLRRLVLRQQGHSPSELTVPFLSQEPPVRLFLRLGILGLRVVFWIAISFYLTNLFPQTRRWRYYLLNRLITFLTSKIFTLGERGYSVIDLVLLLVFTVGLWLAVRSITQLFNSRIISTTVANRGLQNLFSTLTQYVLMFLGLIVLMQIWGLDVSSLAIFASVLGVGIGFGVQNITNNFISGLIITIERSIQVGDLIKVGDLIGTVERLGSRRTEIKTLDNITVIVPNTNLLESQVSNWSHGEPVFRIQLPVVVADNSRVDLVRKALLEAAQAHQQLLSEPQPKVWFEGFDDGALNFSLLVWIREPKEQFHIKSDLYYNIEANLRRYGVEINFEDDLLVKSPQLQQFINTWLEQQRPQTAQNQLYLHHRDKLDTRPQPPPEGTLREPFSENEKSLLGTPGTENLATVDLAALVKAMREPGGLEIKDRQYRMNLYPASFVGSEAVEWLVHHQNCTRQEAIALGQILLARGIIHHVLDEYPFRDDYLFYRFSVDETSQIEN